jgi:predicted 3-demethylubiquinone-9 3-methyltransferase (glyoxalase superfamily)
MSKVTPFLWFDGHAEEAAKFYVKLFKQGSKVTNVSRRGPGKDAPAWSVSFTLRGQDFIALNGGPMFKFTPAVSFFIDCKDQKEIDRFWNALTEGGKPGRCGWLEDRWGLSWQVIPSGLGEWIAHPAGMEAMMKMGKLDIAALKAAAKSGAPAKRPGARK